MRTIIGFCGPIGCGKTTAAQVLIDEMIFYRIRFADPLKAMMRVICSNDEIDGNKKETPSSQLCGKTPRYAMQTLGTEWGRNMMGGEFWVNLFKQRAMTYTGDIVVDDVRFPNEVEAIHSLGGRVFNIIRHSITPQGHSSETQLLAYDDTIYNNLFLDEFKTCILDAVQIHQRLRAMP